MQRATRWLCGAAMLVAVAGLPAMAGKYNDKISIGDPAPKFDGLEGVDGKTYSLSDFQGKDAVVIVFTCNACPVAQAYNERFGKFVAEYKGKPVAFLAINVNRGEGLEVMREFAKEHDLQYPYARDDSQKSGKEFGATVTPHVFVLNKDRKVAYMGLWDDNWQNPDKVEKEYARDAVDAILAGRTVEVAETRQQGCGIKY
jgi:peroxiredoxin